MWTGQNYLHRIKLSELDKIICIGALDKIIETNKKIYIKDNGTNIYSANISGFALRTFFYYFHVTLKTTWG